MMMRGGKDEARVMSPMFPRLHVNDTEKGGPRAPPRNKMALYEQLSIPSQRFNPGSSLSPLPLPPNNNNLVPSISSSHGGGNERSMFMPFGNSHESSVLAGKFHSYPIRGTKINNTKENQENKFSKATDYPSLDTNPQPRAVSKVNTFQPHHSSNCKRFSLRKPGQDNELRVPISVPSGTDRNCSCNKRSEDSESFSKLKLSSSMQLQTANERQIKENDPVDAKSRRYARKQAVENGILFRRSQDHVERSNSTRDKISDLSTKIKNSESLKRPHASFDQENKSCSVDILNGEVRSNAWLHHEYVATQDKMICRENILVESGRSLENASKVRYESCLRQSLGVDNGSPNVLEKRIKAHEEKKTGAMQDGGVNGQSNVPATSMVKSVSPLHICPDDIVAIIGQKHFWKVRRAIVNQQRIFAVQVFELHRLIKVQRLIAVSPNVLLEDTYFMGKPSLDVSPLKKLPSECVPELSLIVKVGDNSRKPNISTERCADENAVAKLPFPPCDDDDDTSVAKLPFPPCDDDDDTSKGLVTQQPKHGTYSAKALSTPMDANTRQSPWAFSPSGNQWLVPVMSPSEGLVYKPYTGPCPPGFLAPVYGSCGPLNLAAGGGDFLSPAYGVPASQHQGIGILPGNPPIGQTYFPHYGMAVRNLSASGSAVEQMSPFTGVQSKLNQLSTGDVNFTMAQQSSCNMSSQMSRAISYRVGKLPASKESEIQGSTASSPPERAKADALPLFPTEPTTQASNHNAQTSGQQTQVIKVIPHNRRLATESAARIFRSIQEERKQYD